MKERNMNAKGRINKKIAFISVLILLFCIVISAGATGKLTKEGLVENIGAQKNIFDPQKADVVVEGVMELKFFEGKENVYAVGPAANLNGEITVLNSKPYTAKVLGNDDSYMVDRTWNNDALFLVWAQIPRWKGIPIPNTVKTYVELQKFIKEQASASGIDVSKPIPFQVSGTPIEMIWHINVNRTGGKKPITRELFVKSKAIYTLKNEPVDIVGFYSEKHYGIYISQYAPAIKPDSGPKNTVHMHFVSRKSKATGHIDDITLGEGMTLSLPEMY